MSEEKIKLDKFWGCVALSHHCLQKVLMIHLQMNRIHVYIQIYEIVKKLCEERTPF